LTTHRVVNPGFMARNPVLPGPGTDEGSGGF
jgi:hypothetical protein